MPADVIVAQSVRCAIVNSETSWNCAESLEERELDRSLSMCANREYVRLFAGRSVGMRERKRASAVFLCVHVYAHASVCTRPTCMSQTREQEAGCVSLWNSEVM